MCVHPTRSGDQCKKNPELFLCGTHLLNPSFKLARGKVNLDGHGICDLGYIGETKTVLDSEGKFFAYDRSMVATTNTRTRAKKVLCGNCVKNDRPDPYHQTIAAVRACYHR